MLLHGYLGATASIRVRFRKPIPTGQEVKVTGEVLDKGPRSWTLASYIVNEHGQVLAEAEGAFAVLSETPPEKPVCE
jgi:acyl-CoA thioesterase FadM